MKQEDMGYSLRSANISDVEFLFQLRIKTMKPFFKDTFGWNDTKEREKAVDELNNTQIVIFDKKEIGVIKVLLKSNELHLHQIQILPEFQRKGFGAELIRQIIINSDDLQIPITLFVVKNTPAKRLYDRFGFVITDEYEHHYKMRWQPEYHQNN
jgi:ribosomal protein S18 acetylase RimI-like enzyme